MTLEVAAIPIVQGVYLSWQVVAAAARYDVRYRPSGDERWIEMPELDRDTRATELRQLPTHPIEIELAAIGADGVVLAASRTTAQPRTEYPSACAQLEQGAGQGSLVGFCSQDDLEAWLVRVGIERTALRCRGQPAPPTGVLPDCSYHLDGKPVLLARALGDRFASPFESPQADAIRRRLRAVLYDDHDPFRSTSAATWTPVVPALTGLVTNFVGAESFAIDVPDTPFITRVTWFDRVPSPRGIALYLEGHSLPAIEPGAATIDSLLALGWSVIAIDMPLEGRNAPDREALSPTADLTLHNVLIGRDAGGVHPIGQMLLPIKAVVDRLERTHRAAPVILVGRSGGGWSSYVYGALDRRIDAVVSVAGGVPVSRRLDPTLRSLGDYEQVAPELYDFAPHELLMAVAGRLGSLHVWSDADPCCYPMGADDPTVSWLRGTSRADHLVEVLVQQHDAHGLNAHGFAALRRFLQRLFP